MKLKIRLLFKMLIYCSVFCIIDSQDQQDEEPFSRVLPNELGGSSGNDLDFLKNVDGKRYDTQLSARDLLLYFNLNGNGKENLQASEGGKEKTVKANTIDGGSFSRTASMKHVANPSTIRKKAKIAQQSALTDIEESPFQTEDRPTPTTEYEFYLDQYKKDYGEDKFKKNPKTTSSKDKKDLHKIFTKLSDKKDGATSGKNFVKALSPDLKEELRKEDSRIMTEMNRNANERLQKNKFFKSDKVDSIPKLREESSRNGYDSLFANFYHQNANPVQKKPPTKLYSGVPLIHLENVNILPNFQGGNLTKTNYTEDLAEDNADNLISDTTNFQGGNFNEEENGHGRKAFKDGYVATHQQHKRLPLSRETTKTIYPGDLVHGYANNLIPETTNFQGGNFNEEESGNGRKAFKGGYVATHQQHKRLPLRRETIKTIYTGDLVHGYANNLIPETTNFQGENLNEEESGDGRKAFKGGYIVGHQKHKSFPLKRENIKTIYTSDLVHDYASNLIPATTGMYRRVYEEKSPIILAHNHHVPYGYNTVRVVKLITNHYSPIIKQTRPFKAERRYFTGSNMVHPFTDHFVDTPKPEHLHPFLQNFSSNSNFVTRPFISWKPGPYNNGFESLSSLENNFSKAYKRFIEALEKYYSDSTLQSNVEGVEESFQKMLSIFRNYEKLLKAVSIADVPESMKKSMESAKRVQETFNNDNGKKVTTKKNEQQFSRRFSDEPIKRKPVSSSLNDYTAAKKHYISALNSYYANLKLFKDNQTDERLGRAVDNYKNVLNAYRIYQLQYKKYMNHLKNKILKGGDLNSNEISNNRALELSKDPLSIANKVVNKRNITSMIDSFRKQKLRYGELEKSYLAKLVSYYKLLKNIPSPDDNHEKDLEDEYTKLKNEHENYSRLYMYLFARNMLPEEEKLYRFQTLPDIFTLNYLNRPSFDDPTKTKEYGEKLSQHDSARLSYLNQLLEYSSAVTDYFSTNSTGSYLNAIDAYKKLIDLRKIYHEVYLYIFDNHVTDSPTYPFPKIPKLFIRRPDNKEKSGVRISVKDISDKDLDKMENDFEMSMKEYEQLSSKFIRFPNDEVLYQQTLAVYAELLRRHSLCEYLYRYLTSNSSKYSQGHHEPGSLKLNLEIQISNLKPPKSAMVSRKLTDLNDIATNLFKEKRSDVLMEKIEQIRKDYEVTIIWYYAMADLLKDKGNIPDVKELSIVDGMKGDYSLLKMYQNLCKIINNRLEETGNATGWECYLEPLPKIS